MNNKNYTNIKTSKLLAEVSGVETEMWHTKIRDGEWRIVDTYEIVGECHPDVEQFPTYTFTDLLAVIDERYKNSLIKKGIVISKSIKKGMERAIGIYNHILIDAYTADGSVMNKENGEVEKFIINLIK